MTQHLVCPTVQWSNGCDHLEPILTQVIHGTFPVPHHMLATLSSSRLKVKTPWLSLLQSDFSWEGETHLICFPSASERASVREREREGILRMMYRAGSRELRGRAPKLAVACLGSLNISRYQMIMIEQMKQMIRQFYVLLVLFGCIFAFCFRGLLLLGNCTWVFVGWAKWWESQTVILEFYWVLSTYCLKVWFLIMLLSLIAED